jgi:hypothetical protein
MIAIRQQSFQIDHSIKTKSRTRPTAPPGDMSGLRTQGSNWAGHPSPFALRIFPAAKSHIPVFESIHCRQVMPPPSATAITRPVPAPLYRPRDRLQTSNGDSLSRRETCAPPPFPFAIPLHCLPFHPVTVGDTDRAVLYFRAIILGSREPSNGTVV